MLTRGVTLLFFVFFLTDLASKVGEILCLLFGEEVDAKEVGRNEEEISEDENTDQVVFTANHSHHCAIHIGDICRQGLNTVHRMLQSDWSIPGCYIT